MKATVQHLRSEARRIRRDAERVKDDEVRRKMLDIAVQYERLADGLEEDERR